MYKVLIIDDEQTIRKGLRKIIDWEYYEFQIVGDAASVEEGLRLLSEWSPDLVILDMKLSKSTGIDFAREARTAGWKGRIIIVSGYSDFEFARQSLQYDVVDYLLKPVSTEKLTKSLIRTRQLISESSYSDYISEQSITKLRSHILSALLRGSFQYADRLKTTYNLDLSKGPFQLFCIYPKYEERKVYWNDMAKQLGSYFVEEDRAYYLILKGNKSLFYIKTINKSETETYIYSRKFSSIDLLNEQYLECKKAVDHLFFLKTKSNEILLPLPEKETVGNLSMEEAASEIYQDIQTGTENKLEEIVFSLYATIPRQCADVSSAIIFLLQLYSSVLKKMKRGNEDIVQYVLSYDDLSKRISYKSLYENLEIIFREFSNALSYYHSVSSDNIVEKVKRYVHDNYWKSDLKLESIASVFGYNSAYLGKRFSKESGTSFNSFLDTVRLENSLKLLSEHKRIYEVTEACGFSNADYFTKKFKKYFNMLPTEYQHNLQE